MTGNLFSSMELICSGNSDLFLGSGEDILSELVDGRMESWDTANIFYLRVTRGHQECESF